MGSGEPWRAEGKELLKQTKEWQEVMSDEFYRDIQGDEDAVASEVLARIVGQDAARQINEMFAPENKPQERPGIYNKIQQWISKFLDGVRSLFADNAKGLTYDELVRMPMKALFDDAEAKRFMEALKQVNEEDVDLSSQGSVMTEGQPLFQIEKSNRPYSDQENEILNRAQGHVEKFKEKYQSDKIHVVLSYDRDAMLNIPAFVHDFDDEPDVNQRQKYIEELLDDIKNKNDLGISLSRSGEILIFADRIGSEEEAEGTIFHENVHSWLRRQFGIDSARSICENYWNATSNDLGDLHDDIKKEYKEHSELQQHEELFSYMMELALITGNFHFIDKYLTDDLDRHYLDKLLNFLKYDRRKEKKDRRTQARTRRGTEIQEEPAQSSIDSLSSSQSEVGGTRKTTDGGRRGEGNGEVAAGGVRADSAQYNDGTQGDQTRSANFKNWFGDWENDPENASKVVDENGRPLVMTHNTDNEFYTFERERIGSGQGQAYLGFGFNFSRGRNSTYGNNAMQVYLDAKNPLESDGHKLTRADLEKTLRQIDD